MREHDLPWAMWLATHAKHRNILSLGGKPNKDLIVQYTEMEKSYDIVTSCVAGTVCNPTNRLSFAA